MTDKQSDMVDEILITETGMTRRELEFIESLDNNRDRELTEPQFDWLSDIWRRTHP